MTSFAGNGGAFLLVFMTVLLLAALLPASRLVALGVSLAATLSAFAIPLGEASAFAFIRSAMGQPSAALFVVSGFSLAAFALKRPVVEGKDEALFAGMVSALGLVLYASATGYLPFDLYSLGYRPQALAVILALALGAAALFRSSMTMVWVAASAAFHLAGASTSVNAFDAVIDAPAWFAALSLSFCHLWAKAAGRGLPYWGHRMSSRPGGRTIQAVHA